LTSQSRQSPKIVLLEPVRRIVNHTNLWSKNVRRPLRENAPQARRPHFALAGKLLDGQSRGPLEDGPTRTVACLGDALAEAQTPPKARLKLVAG
jgi:hypothetical protein